MNENIKKIIVEEVQLFIMERQYSKLMCEGNMSDIINKTKSFISKGIKISLIAAALYSVGYSQTQTDNILKSAGANTEYTINNQDESRTYSNIDELEADFKSDMSYFQKFKDKPGLVTINNEIYQFKYGSSKDLQIAVDRASWKMPPAKHRCINRKSDVFHVVVVFQNK